MNRTLIAIVLMLCSLSSNAQVVGPDGFQDDLLSHLEGDWTLRRQIRGTTATNTVDTRWVLNHQFLLMHMKDVKTPSTYEAMVLIGYDASLKKYVAHWTDTFGGEYSAIGDGRRTGDSIAFRFAYPDGPFFNTFTWSPARDEWVMRLESEDPKTGERTLFAVDTLRRATAPRSP